MSLGASTDLDPKSRVGAGVGAGLALMLVAASQRTGLAGVPPLFEDISADTGLDDAGLGMLSTLPIVAMGLLAPAAGALGRFLGAQRGLLVGLLLVAIGSLLRLFDPVLLTLFVGAVLVGAGITTIGTLMPAALVDRLPRTVGLWTGLTTFSLALGATLAAALAIPLAQWLGGWQASLAVWSIPALLGLLIWIPMAAHTHDRPPQDPLPWKSGTAWLVVGFTTLGTAAFFAALSWTAATYTDAGLGEQGRRSC